MEPLQTCFNEEAGVYVYVGNVKPAMKEKSREGKAFYDLWLVLEGKGANCC